MFERFTHAARKVLVYAQEAAVEYEHEWLGTEHLLLGILDGNGTAAIALEDCGVDRERALAYVAALDRDGRRGTAPRFSTETKKTMEGSLREALALGHSHIGPEHLLLGLLRAEESPAIDLIRECGTDRKTVRETLLQTMRDGGSARRRVSPAAKNVEINARDLASDAAVLTTQHFLLALLAERESLAAKVLELLGVTEQKVKEAAEQIPVETTTDGTPQKRGPATVQLAPGVVLKADDAAKLTALDIEALKKKLSGGS